MAENSHIQWTDHTFNPWWGCTKVSQGCKNCYADRDSTRYGFKLFGPTAERRFFGDKHWEAPLKWNAEAEKMGERKRVFCASMSDVFEGPDTCREDDFKKMMGARIDLAYLISQTHWLDWLILTKRPENVPAFWHDMSATSTYKLPDNVWIGTSCEDQETAEERVPLLLKIPAVIHFLSCEPLLGPIELSDWLWGKNPPCADCPKDIDCECGFKTAKENGIPTIDWVIAGGESGPAARPMHENWVRRLRDDCLNTGYLSGSPTPFHFKQWGEFGEDGSRVGRMRAGRTLDGRTWDELPQVKFPVSTGTPTLR